jgi:hypothetical protein
MLPCPADNGTMPGFVGNMRSSRGVLVVSVLAALCSGCGPHPIIDRRWPDAYWRHGPYVLIAIDTEAQMSLAFDSHGKRDGLVGPTVFAVGADDRFVVAMQHPCDDGIHFDRAVTNYFIVDRATEASPGGPRSPEVEGPLSKAEFDDLSRELGLPGFSKTFADLEWHRTGAAAR